jgi:NhaA family Na+:H+ antiporter
VTHDDSAAAPSIELPSRPVERLLAPIQRFLHVQASSGVVLLVCTAAALVLANSPWAKGFAAFWKTPVELQVGAFRLADTLGHLIINDGLMTIFFFVVGLEIKREIVGGELAELRKALLPVIAAAGGMLMPAVVYLVFQWGQPGQRGWAIPMATDIAFVVGFLALFGERVPFGLKIFLLSLAIVDDLGAVLIIALAFSEPLVWSWLGVAAVGLVATSLLNFLGVRQVAVYVLVGVVVWLGFLEGGIHPTVAGVVLGLMTPARPWLGESLFEQMLGGLWHDETRPAKEPVEKLADVKRLQFAAGETVAPLHRLESALHPWVAYGIMPLFALANAGVRLEAAALGEPVAAAVAAGLVIGKPLGILLFCFVGIRLGVTALPAGVSWRMLIGAACLAGIGFTMALFLNGLAFPAASFAEQEAAGKIGVLTGSLISAALGAVVLATALRRSPTGGEN